MTAASNNNNHRNTSNDPANTVNSSSFSLINYVTLVILLLMIGVQAYNFWQSRNETFSGVWIVRICVLLLILSFLATFIISAFFHRFTIDQLPSCATIQYFRFRWYIFVMAAISLSAIPVYLAITRKTQQNLLLILLASQIQINLFTVMLTVIFDSISRYFYQKQLNQRQQQQEQQQNMRPQSPISTSTAPQLGYFSPKTKGPAPLSSQKNPFESSKFRYAR